MGVHMSEPDATWWTLGDVVEWVQPHIGRKTRRTPARCSRSITAGRSDIPIDGHARVFAPKRTGPRAPMRICPDRGRRVESDRLRRYPQTSGTICPTFFARRTPGMDRRYEVGPGAGARPVGFAG